MKITTTTVSLQQGYATEGWQEKTGITCLSKNSSIDAN